MNRNELENAVMAVRLSRQGKVDEADSWEKNIGRDLTQAEWDIAHKVVDKEVKK